MNYEKSIYFRDIANMEYFLFQIVNYGKDTELRIPAKTATYSENNFTT